jgi:hypothetical protein
MANTPFPIPAHQTGRVPISGTRLSDRLLTVGHTTDNPSMLVSRDDTLGQ